jgi:RNA polymerase sigma-70 factor, ECF subfamily
MRAATSSTATWFSSSVVDYSHGKRREGTAVRLRPCVQNRRADVWTCGDMYLAPWMGDTDRELLAAPLRRELHLHCYRMLGSLHDADDALQETLLRAWRARDSFEPRAPVRAWAYRIATNVCLTALERRERRKEDPLAHLEPFPDRLLAGPEADAEAREAVELAFVAAVQLLPPRQRAVLLLRDVLGWSAREAAELLDTSVASVNSALQRARATVEREHREGRVGRAHAPAAGEVERELVRRFVAAWHAADVDAIAALLAEDALLTMPPLPLRVAGREAIGEFLRTRPAGGRLERFHLVETAANGRPAVALYLDGEAHAVMTLGLQDGEIAALTRFGDPRLFERFGLPTDEFAARRGL